MLKRILFTFAWLCIMAVPARAADISVACAANFTSAMKELVELYAEQTGTEIGCVFGSTGMLYGQIINGAPYDVFFAADEKRPRLLHEQGLAATPFVYARGRVVLWSRASVLSGLQDWQEALTAGKGKIGLANPKTAPYGQRALEALHERDLYARVEDRLVYGKNVGAAFQFAYSSASQVSFIALSQALSTKGREGEYWDIPEAATVRQAACLLQDTDEAVEFTSWLETPQARMIIKGYGYE